MAGLCNDGGVEGFVALGARAVEEKAVLATGPLGEVAASTNAFGVGFVFFEMRLLEGCK